MLLPTKLIKSRLKNKPRVIIFKLKFSKYCYYTARITWFVELLINPLARGKVFAFSFFDAGINDENEIKRKKKE